MRKILITLSIFVFLIISTWAFARDEMSGALLASYDLTDQQFENKAKEYLGVPYRRGVSRRGMDCSGFARVLYDKLFSIDLPHNSIDHRQLLEKKICWLQALHDR